MPITASTQTSINGNTQSIQFFNPGLLDEYDLVSNNIVLKAHSAFNLSQSDYLTHFQYLVSYFQSLLTNFNILNQLINTVLPACECDMIIKLTGLPSISYVQKSGNTTAENISYDINTKIATFANKPNDVTITIQEFGTMIDYKKVYAKQVSLY